jgi:hypothetical protein
VGEDRTGQECERRERKIDHSLDRVHCASSPKEASLLEGAVADDDIAQEQGMPSAKAHPDRGGRSGARFPRLVVTTAADQR